MSTPSVGRRWNPFASSISIINHRRGELSTDIATESMAFSREYYLSRSVGPKPLTTYTCPKKFNRCPGWWRTCWSWWSRCEPLNSFESNWTPFHNPCSTWHFRTFQGKLSLVPMDSHQSTTNSLGFPVCYQNAWQTCYPWSTPSCKSRSRTATNPSSLCLWLAWAQSRSLRRWAACLIGPKLCP